MKNFHLMIIGCQQNEHDGMRLANVLNKLGFSESSEKDAEVIFVLACAVRQTAVDKIFGKIKNNPNKKFIISGCVLQSDKKKLLKKGATFWDFEKPEELAEILRLDDIEIKSLLESSKKISSSVPIMFGCNNYCSYCATPYTRGNERSRKYEDIISDVQALIRDGKKEILLLGQNVNSYKDPSSLKTFEDLLKVLNSLQGDFIIAFMSNHPKDMTDGVINAVAKLPKIKKEIHLPLQSGSDKILKAMNRPYTRDSYLKIVEKIKQANPDITITTDVIVGFPGESEEDFEHTVDIFERVGFKMAYINKYSPRFGTAAYKLGDPISWKEKQVRWHKLDQVLSKTRR